MYIRLRATLPTLHKTKPTSTTRKVIRTPLRSPRVESFLRDMCTDFRTFQAKKEAPPSMKSSQMKTHLQTTMLTSAKHPIQMLQQAATKRRNPTMNT